jgi:hypothetical protein
MDFDQPFQVPKIAQGEATGEMHTVWPGHDRMCPHCAGWMLPKYVNPANPDTLVGWCCACCNAWHRVRPMKLV